MSVSSQLLFKKAMNREWETVCELYKDEKVQGEHINSAKDTLLHIAISNATENLVLDLLDIVHVNKDMPVILNIKNKTGDTPLHLAAAGGLKKVCRRIAKMCPDMVTSSRNDLQETPLFSAVRHGKKNAFFELEVAIHMKQKLTIDEDCLSKRDISHCRGDDGNNILHYTIKGENFDLAYEIIHLYPSLVNYFNSSGQTALHTLANKPSVFKSGARFGLFDTIIYHFTITEPLEYHFGNFKEKVSKEKKDELPGILQKYENKVLPPTYNVCIDLFSLMKKTISCLFNTYASCRKIGIYKASCTDVENPSSSSKPVAASSSKSAGAQMEPRRMFPQNYDMMILFFKMIVKLLLVVVLGIGSRRQSITKIKQQHRNAKKIMKEMVEHSTLWEYENASGGKEPDDESSTVINGETHIRKALPPKKSSVEATDQGSPVLVAAKRGTTEMMKRILKRYPVALMDKDNDRKNIVLLAVEHRQVHVYSYMLGFPLVENIFRKVDIDGNSALHLAAKLSHSRPWTTGAALQMQWEFKWYKYVLSSMNQEIFSLNKEGKTPPEVFSESHNTLIKDGINWLTSISQSCSTVSALFATVAFASVNTVPGGLDQQSGFPILGNRPTFQLFAISSLVALCFSVTSIVMFLAILTSSFKVRDFEWGLPVKLILGLTSLFIAIASTLISFCVGDFFLVAKNLRFGVYPIYAIMCFAVTFFAVAHYPLYISLNKLTIKKFPEPVEVQDY